MNNEPAGAAGAEPVRRTSEIEDVTNLYFIHPISAKLVKLFARLGISPNTVSIGGMACGVLAGVAYSGYHERWCAVAGFALMLSWHILDGADGQLARLTKSYSDLGKVLDGICDYVTFAAVYVGLAVTLSRDLGGWVWWLVAVSGICHALQSAAYEMQRQEYNFWGWGRKSAALPELQAPPRRQGVSFMQRMPDIIHRRYTRMQMLVAGDALAFHRTLAKILAARPASDALIRQRYREAFAPAVRQWAILSANYRTLAIAAAALLQVPLFYFVFEIVGLGFILIVLLAKQRARYRQFLEELGEM
ncbi:MAG: CDP-alcohol phosphatidyltransferase family protein [Acidocella sp.]|nr:CDP-alcohol phosphatidyltransferase family protein [Acidocella sp.]